MISKQTSELQIISRRELPFASQSWQVKFRLLLSRDGIQRTKL